MDKAALLALGLGLASCLGCDSRRAHHQAVDAPTEPAEAAGLIRALEEARYQVRRGSVAPFFIEDCAALPSCYGSNASSPYLLWRVPSVPGAVVTGEASVWQLREDEAVVLIGRTPPPAAYYSYTPYVFSRLDAERRAHATVYASLSDALNLANIRTGSDQVFDRQVAIVLAADSVTHAAVRSALLRAGVAEAAINTLALSTQTAHLGLGPDRDTLQVLGRVALFDDPALGRAYLERPPLTLLRVTPAQPRAADPLAVPARSVRGSGTDERRLLPGLDALEAAVRAKLSGQYVAPVTIFSAAVIASMLDPQRCLSTLSNCLGEVSDTTYAAGPRAAASGGTPLRLGTDAGEYFMALGVNHAATGKATYSNVVVQNQTKQAGVAAFTSRAMPGSAQRYLPDHPDAGLLFAVKIARDCAGEAHCISVPSKFPGVAPDQDVSFAFRAYLEPGRSVSAAPSELLTERVLHVTRSPKTAN